MLLRLAEAWLGSEGRPNARLYVGVNGGLYAFLKWIVEQPDHVDRDAFIAGLTDHAVAALEADLEGRSAELAATLSARTLGA